MSSYPPEDQSSSTPLFDQTGYAPPLSSESVDFGDSESSLGKADAAKDQAGKVASDAQDAAGHVAGVTKEQAGQVAFEVTSQAKDLFAQTTAELKDQAGTQQQKVAQGLRSVSDELSSMAEKSDGNGVASELVRNLSGRAGSAASWLDGRDPGSLLDEVKSFAARKPGTFIAIAAGAGILAGRLAKSLAAEAKSESSTPDVAHAPQTRAPEAGYVRTAAPVEATPVETVSAASDYDEYADDRTFDALVDGSTSAERPLGEQR